MYGNVAFVTIMIVTVNIVYDIHETGWDGSHSRGFRTCAKALRQTIAIAITIKIFLISLFIKSFAKIQFLFYT